MPSLSDTTSPFVRCRRLLLAAALSVLPATIGMSQTPPGTAQVTAADYDRARALQNATTLVRNAVVVHHWIGVRDEFWYRKETPAGAVFVIVDATTGRARPAFDHAAVATALSAALGRNVPPDRLPLANLAFGRDGATVSVTVAAPEAGAIDRAFNCRLTPPVRCVGSGRPLWRVGEGRQPLGKRHVQWRGTAAHP
jgi:hypothetical protein